MSAAYKNHLEHPKSRHPGLVPSSYVCFLRYFLLENSLVDSKGETHCSTNIVIKNHHLAPKEETPIFPCSFIKFS